MPGTYSHTTRADGSVLTGSIYNGDHQNHITFQTPGGTDDYSTNVAQMQSAVDPGEVGTESLPTDLAGELQRFRKIFTEITGRTYWYESPVYLTTVASATTPDIFASLVGAVVDYTGTATCTGFVAAPKAGIQRTLVCAGAAVFTAGANMLIDGVSSGSNFTASAGDKLYVIAVTTTQFRVAVAKADGTPLGADNKTLLSVMENGRITVTMLGNAVTIALKGNNGNDPSASNPVKVTFRSATATDGSFVTRTITSAMSTVITAGSTGGTVNAIPARIYVGLLDNAGTVELYWWNPVSGTNLYAPPEAELITTVAEGGAGAADSAQVLYSTTLRATVAHRIVAYFEATEATAGTWATAASKIQLMGPGVKRTGDRVQTQRNTTGAVATGTTAVPEDDTIPQITEGDQYMTQAITPTNAVNILRVYHQGQYSHSTTNGKMVVFLCQDAIANALAVMAENIAGADHTFDMQLTYEKSAGSTSSITMRIRAGMGAGATTTFNGSSATRIYGGVAASTLQIEEICA